MKIIIKNTDIKIACPHEKESGILPNKNTPSYEVSKELIKAITKYASNICKEITGNEYTPIYLGTQFNDIKIFDKTEEQRIKFLGELDCERIYLDAFEGWKNTFALDKKVCLYKLN